MFCSCRISTDRCLARSLCNSRASCLNASGRRLHAIWITISYDAFAYGKEWLGAIKQCCDLFVRLSVYYMLLAQYSWNSMGPTPTLTQTLGMCLSCNFVNVYTTAYRVQYTRTCANARITNQQTREDPGEEKRAACRTSRRTSRRGSSCVSGSWQAERGSRRTRRLPRVPRQADFRARQTRLSRGSRRGCPCRCRSHGIPA